MTINRTSVVGFVTAVSDGVLSAYIPLLEVLPEYQDRGIGSELMRRILEQLDDLYMVDVLCDAESAGVLRALWHAAGGGDVHPALRQGSDLGKSDN